jgi:DNA-binding IclR family transcriptional regulator
VNNLYESGLLKRDPFGKGHIPGDNLQKLARLVLLHEVFSAPRRAMLQQLSEEVGETCNITILDGKNPVYFDRVETDWPIRGQLPLGSRVPIHCTASGKLFLANMSKRSRMEILNNMELKRHTEKTITDIDGLLSEIDQIRKTGIGTDNEEFIKGMVAVAVPVIDKNDSMIFSIAIHAPTLRSSISELRQYVPSMRRTAAAIDRLYAGSET